MNDTVPEVTGLPPEVTVAVRVTGDPVCAGFGDPASWVDVLAAATVVVMVRFHPPLMAPVSPVLSSTT